MNVKVVTGKYTKAFVYATTVDENSLAQIKKLCDQKFTEGEQIRIMPDTHQGTGCVIGFTMTLKNLSVCPNLVGVDIGCGILVSKFANSEIDLERLDAIIHEKVPSGMSVNESSLPSFVDLTDLKCYEFLRHTNRLNQSMGTLGGGNHFIEVDIDEAGNKYLVIHSGSRNLGVQVCEFYQNLAIEKCGDLKGIRDRYNFIIEENIDKLKHCGKQIKIQEMIEAQRVLMNAEIEKAVPDKNLAFLTGDDFDNYINDMTICQNWANENRITMANTIASNLGIGFSEWFDTVHNYINVEDLILRKGAISAKYGEKVAIPLNMQDGTIIATGLGNPEWNQSAPHGAGRLMSRTAARSRIKMSDFKKSMEGIYTTSVCGDTIDEAPQAYKSAEEILANIKDTCKVLEVIHPVYNFKAKEDGLFSKRYNKE